MKPNFKKQNLTRIAFSCSISVCNLHFYAVYCSSNCIYIYICSSWLLAFNRAFMYEENDYYIHKTGCLSSFLFLFLPHFSIHSPLKAREKCNENGQNQHSISNEIFFNLVIRIHWELIIEFFFKKNIE